MPDLFIEKFNDTDCASHARQTKYLEMGVFICKDLVSVRKSSKNCTRNYSWQVWSFFTLFTSGQVSTLFTSGQVFTTGRLLRSNQLVWNLSPLQRWIRHWRINWFWNLFGINWFWLEQFPKSSPQTNFRSLQAFFIYFTIGQIFTYSADPVHIGSYKVWILYKGDQVLRNDCLYLKSSGFGWKNLRRKNPEPLWTKFQFLLTYLIKGHILTFTDQPFFPNWIIWTVFLQQRSPSTQN